MDKKQKTIVDKLIYDVGDEVSFIFAGFEREGIIERISKAGESDRIEKALYFIRGFVTGYLYPIHADKILHKL